MPITVTASNGQQYHLWQLPDASAPEPEDSHEFSTLNNESGGGYRSSRLLGLDTGLRSWRLTLPTLAGASVLPNTVTDVDGITQVSRLEYVKRLFRHNRTTGIPFAYEWQGQYYLVDFVNHSLELERAERVEIYRTEIELRQRRMHGTSIFQVDRLGYAYASEAWLAQWLQASSYNIDTGVWPGSYVPPEGSGNAMGVGGIAKLVANQNGHDVVRLDGTDDQIDVMAGDAKMIREGFIVCKFREVSFTGSFGLLTDQAAGGTIAMRTVSGTTRFEDRGWAANTYEYRLNGTQYAANDQQAPMNKWGVVHFRYTTGWSWTSGYRIGRDRDTAGSYAPVDIGEVILCEYALPRYVSREVTEYLMTKWGLLA